MGADQKREPPKTLFVAPVPLNERPRSDISPLKMTLAGTKIVSGVESDVKELGSSEQELNGPASVAEGLAEGAQIGQYEIIRQLGRGGMGVVYLARDNKLGRKVAIKFLQIRHAELRRRFIVEARATARCTHENIVVIHEVNEHAGDPFMVLEYLEGQPLSELRGSGALPVTRVVEIMYAVVRALARAHDEGIVHRDLKPENIFLCQSGAIKVLDFGIAKLLEGNPTSVAAPISLRRTSMASGIHGTSQTGLVGTMAYMSPEQWAEGGDVDHRTDIWSVGLMLYEFLAGKHPLIEFGMHVGEWVQQLDVPVPSLESLVPDIPNELSQLVDNCLRKQRAERIPSARDLLRALEPFTPGRYQVGQAQVESGPYAGLRAFQEEDASRFFGRSSELAEMMTRLRETPMMAAIGPSGVGKSSFLRAGIIPAMRSTGDNLIVLTIRPGRYPLLALAGLCAPFVDPASVQLPRVGADNALRARLTNEPGFMGAVLREFCRRKRKRIFLLIDQFEELYTLGAHTLERQSFTACLSGTADDPMAPIRIVLTIRADFLGRVAEDANLMNQLRSGLFFLGPPSKEGLRDALIRPAEGAGYRFENMEMVNEMVHFLESSPNGLPLLQFAASQLWETRDPTRHVLTEQAYRGLGGVAGALVSHADRVVSRLSAAQQTLCRSIFVHLVTPERTRAVRNLQELGELAGNLEEVKPLIDELVDSRLLVVQTHSDTATVEIVHESLILNWPTLRRWLDASQEDSQFLDQLLGAAHQWEINRKATGMLWSGEMVDELNRFLRRYKGQLPKRADAFVSAVKRQALRRVRIRRALALTGVLLVAAIFAAGSVALVVISRAKAQAEKNAGAARKAEVEAQQRLREWIQAETQRKEAEKQKTALEGRVKLSAEELAAKNVELTLALKRAEEQRSVAEQAKDDAERNEKLALEERTKAERAATQLSQNLEREKERADKLKEQIGPFVEELK